MTGTTRAERMAMPLAGPALRALTEACAGCLRPVQMRRTSLDDGTVSYIVIPCGATLESACPACAKRAKTLRAQQLRDGWHLETEPITTPSGADDDQGAWLTLRAQAQVMRDNAETSGRDTAWWDELISELDDAITAAGIRGKLTPGTRTGAQQNRRRVRSTRRRQDSPDLPGKPITAATTGKVYTAPNGKTYRPSMFITLTCPSYGKVRDDGTPASPGSYDYTAAARDALHFAALTDRLIQNIRRYLGRDVQYFAAIEPQRRLAPHLHLALRGTVSRTDLRKIIAATYHQVWWPRTDEVRYDGDCLPQWHESTGRYLDPATGELLPSWDYAVDAIDPADQPAHVARFGPKFDAQGVLAGSPGAARCIGYLTKYLTKQLGRCHEAATDAEHAHADRLIEALRYEPCSPACANWLRYGITPKNPRPGLTPGRCKGKAHRRENLGYAGRRVLVSRKWSGKTLADHRADRKAWLLETLGLPADQPQHYKWERVTPADHDCWTPTRRLLHVLDDRARWLTALDQARRRARDHPGGNIGAAEQGAA